MKVTRVALVVLAAAVIGAMLWKDSLGQAPAPAPAPAAESQGPVAVVDAEEVIQNYSRAKDIRKDLENRRQQVDLEVRKRRDSIDAIEAILKSGQLTEGSAEWSRQINEQARQVFEMDAYQKHQYGILMIEQHASLRGLYDEVSLAVSKIAKERGLKVVLATSHKTPRTDNINDLREVIRDRKVLFGDPSVDITEMVLKHLNDAQRAVTTRP